MKYTFRSLLAFLPTRLYNYRFIKINASTSLFLQSKDLDSNSTKTSHSADNFVSSSGSRWHLTFQIPLHYSKCTEEAIKTGQLTKRNRTEIIQSLSSSIMVHTDEPSGEQYNTVCKKLIPKLTDGIGASGYVSIIIRIVLYNVL